MSFIYGIGASSGVRVPLSAAVDFVNPEMAPETRSWIGDPAREGAIAVLKGDGFKTFVAPDAEVAELAREALAETIALGQTPPDQIDAVIFATESFWDDPQGFSDDPFRHFALRNRLLQVMAEVGVVNASPYGNWLSACANLGTSLILAKALVTSGQHRQVAVVVADRVSRRLPRLMHNGAGVVSDIATSCLVSLDPGELEITAIATASAPKMATYNLEDKGELGKIVVETMKALQRLERQFSALTGRRPSEFETVIAGHYHAMSLKVLTDALKIRPEHIRRDARAEFGHAYASDNLLTIKQMQNSGDIDYGQELLVLNTGLWTWSLVALKVAKL